MSTALRTFYAPVEFGTSLGTTALVATTDARIEPVDQQDARALLHCRGARSLHEHAAAIWLAGVVPSPPEAEDLVRYLCRRGLLIEFRPPDRVDEPSRVPASIGSVVYITADRPEQLELSLRSAIHHCRRYGRDPSFIVIDGSARYAALTEARVDVVRATLGATIDYWGPKQSVSLAEEAGRVVGDPDLMMWALATGTIGANRNVATLVTAGTSIIMSDDDIEWTVWRAQRYQPGFECGGHQDPCQGRWV